MTKIHHTITKAAAKLGLTIVQNADGTVTIGGYTAATAKDALALVNTARKPTRAAKADEGDEEDGNEDGPGTTDDDATGEAEEDGSEYDGLSRSVVKPHYKAAYKPHDDTCGDEFTVAFTDECHDPETDTVDMAALVAIAKANGVDMGRWAGRNVGMQRMNLGNVLRGLMRQGKRVVIGKNVFELTEAQKVAAVKRKAEQKAARKAARAAKRAAKAPRTKAKAVKPAKVAKAKPAPRKAK